METKKNSQVNLERYRGLFFQIGLIIVLTAVIAIFGYKRDTSKDYEIYNLNFSSAGNTEIDLEQDLGEIQIQAPNTQKIVQVDDDTVIADSTEVDDSDGNIGNNHKSNGNANNNPLYSAEIMPEYPGGITALKRDLAKAIKLPKGVSSGQISGTVYIQFTVSSKGDTGEFLVKKSLDKKLDQEIINALALIKKFKPASQNGKPVAVYFILPLSFNL